MKLYIKTNEDGQITESCPTKMEWTTEITCTTEQFELIKKQYDTIVVNWKITTQTKWEAATNLEISKETTEE